MSTLALASTLESLWDGLITSDPQTVHNYMANLRSTYPSLSTRELAQKVVDEQSINSGVLGAITGLGSFTALPLIIPLDIIKAWKIQDFTIRCIATLYGYPPQASDLKTAVLLLTTNGSMAELQQFVLMETSAAIGEYTLSNFDAWKKTAIQVVLKEGAEQTAKTLSKSSNQLVAKLGMKEMVKYLSKALWKSSSKKAIEKTMQRIVGVALPMLGGIVGGSVDWITTQAVGRLTIEYFENSGPEFVNSVLKGAS